MNWVEDDFAMAFSCGFMISPTGRFYMPGQCVQEVSHDNTLLRLTEQAAAGDEFAARALAEALRRRMTK